MTSPAIIPTLAETTELAVDVSLVLRSHVTIRGNTFRVVQWSNELRFFQRSGMRWLGDNGESVHVEILRGDLVRAATLPGGYRNVKLEADCVAIVKAALAQVAA